MNADLVHAVGLTRRYPIGESSVGAISDINLTISRGEFTTLVGPSGSGKSTLLNLIGGLDRPTSGEVLVDGLSLALASDQELVRYRRERVGFIFQNFNLLPTLSAAENVALPMTLAEISPRERHSRAMDLLESVGLGQRIAHKPNQLSGGERQRVAIARALANRPALLLADEPTGNLDSKTGAAVLDLLCALIRKEGLTLVMVTHDLNVASRADRIVHLHDGSIQNVVTNQAGISA